MIGKGGEGQREKGSEWGRGRRKGVGRERLIVLIPPQAPLV